MFSYVLLELETQECVVERLYDNLQSVYSDAVKIAFVFVAGTANMSNPNENTEEGNEDYASTYAKTEGQASSGRKAAPVRTRSRRESNSLPPQECSNYTILSSPDRARGAIIMSSNYTCDSTTLAPGWYRFSGDAGNEMALSCVPRLRCGAHAPGWMNGIHPMANQSIVEREVCFNWNGDCCNLKHRIRVRNCGHFYIYEFLSGLCTKDSSLRYCGNALGPLNKTLECGENFTNLTGQITSPGYPNYMEPITCQWTIKAPSNGMKILLCFENLILNYEGCSSNITIGTSGKEETICTTNKTHLCRQYGNKIVSIRYQSSEWKMKVGFTLRYAMIKGDLNNVSAVEQNEWNISVKVNNSSEIQVSWQAFNGSLDANGYVYGYVVVCKPANQPPVYVPTGPNPSTISIPGLTGGTEYTVQVVALVSEYGRRSAKSMNGSSVITTRTEKGECEYYENLTSRSRAQGAPGFPLSDHDMSVSWYRFGGEAGTQIATSCVPKWRCGAEAPGWMLGKHPQVEDGIVRRTVCFHWSDDCCLWRNTIEVRNCGGYYVYLLRRPPAINLRYCGNKGGCGKSINDTSGTLKSPGYPTRIYWNTKCQWNFTAPSPTGVIVVIVEHLSIPRSDRCLKFSFSLENANGKEVDKVCGIRRSFTWMSQGSAKLRFFSERAASRWIGFKARYFIFKNDLTNITVFSRWTGVNATAINSTAMTVQWGPYPASPVNPSVTEYLVICVPDGLPLNATVFTTDISQNSINVTGLMKYTNYTVQIVVDKNGNSSSFDDYRRSQSTRVRTKEDVPSEGPQNLKAVATGNNTITVSWKPIPEHAHNGEIKSYVIYYKKAWTSDNHSRININSSAAEAILRNLEPATEYRIEMSGVTSIGVGTKTRAVFAITGCKDYQLAGKGQLTWTFTSPHYPSQYPSNLNCTWSIDSSIGVNEEMYIVFDEFHLEEKISTKCSSDYVSIVQSNGKNDQIFCGKQDPFAVLMNRSGEVRLKSDGGFEEKGFHARVFAFIREPYDISLIFNDNNNVIYNNTLQWKKPTIDKVILEYVVLYRGVNDTIWKASITNTTKAILTGLDPQKAETYEVILLFRTSDGMAYRGKTKEFVLLTPQATSGNNPTPTPEPPTINQMLGMYPYGDIADDSLVPNTVNYSTRCFPIDVPDDGMQFFEKRHHKIHICRNGLLLFETPQLIRWPRRFSEQHYSLRTAAMLAPYWALTDVHDSFVSLGISKVYYQVYKDTDSNERSRIILHQASYHVKNNFNATGIINKLVRDFSAKWVLKVTWVDLRYPGTTKLALTLNNTFQAVIMTDGTHSFAMFNYPKNGINWAAPTERKYYKLYSTNNPGLPVVGFNSGEHNTEVPRHYDVIGSGTPGIVNIDHLNGSTVYPIKLTKSGATKTLDSATHGSPGTWLFRLEDHNGRNFKQKCIDWYKRESDHREFTEHLEPCPCTYRQAMWDERFAMDPEERHRICAYTVFRSIHGWGQECCYQKTTAGPLIKGFPHGGTARKNYERGKKTMKELGYMECCTYSNMCHLYYKRRPSNNCDGYKRTEWSLLFGDPHFVTLDGLNYTFNGLGEYIMADISNGLFQLQARTKQVEGGGKATVFVSAVAKETGSSAVQVNLKHGQGIEVLVNGTAIDHNGLPNTATLFNGSVALSRPDTNSITVLFPSGISVKMTEVKESLAILLAAPKKFKNKTRGLLGVWNGDPEDDLTTPTGLVLPTNSTARGIHYEFGQKWQVTNLNSLFTYEQGESVNTFSNPSFEPMFLDDFNFTNNVVKQEAVAKCEGDVNCLYDAALTNDVTIGTSTKIVGSRFMNESEALKNSVPKFLNLSSTFFVTVNTTARIEIFAKDDDGDPLTFHVSGTLPETLSKDTRSGRSIVISWKVTMNKVKFEVIVMDDKGAAALWRPKIHLCACHHGGYCSPDTSNNVFADSTNDTFLIMPCTCIHGYTGRFCENDLDACQANLNPCYPGVKCTDLPPPEDVFGYRCGPCPRGFSGDGATCLDLDECEGGKDDCSQICVNTPGSFVCDCNQGYRLSIDQKTCNDIDECFPSSDCMQKCKNTNGSYTCECDAGFKVDPNNPKKCVAKVPCTDGNHGCQHICYTKDGRQQCACHQGYKLLDDQKSCEDIDECSTRKYRCNQYCHNTMGSYSCSCKKGFRMNNDGVTCADVDECMDLTYQCPDPSQICLNTAGSYKCVCGPGLYLTVNNTCREILPGHTTPSPGPAPTPKPPSDNEKDNAVRITVKALNISEWNERLDNKFKQSVAKAVTSFCASKDEECQETRKRERRALDYIPYTADQVHLLPGFPKQTKSRDLAAVISFYVEFPPEVVSTSGDSIEGEILVKIVSSAKVVIEKALNRTISSITLNKKEEPSTKKNPEKFNIYVIIGVSLAGVLVLGIVGLLIRRKTRNAILHIKRKQDKEDRKRRARNVNNACYDDGTPGEFQFGPAQSTIDILGGSGKECVQSTEIGIDSLGVDVKKSITLYP